MSKESTTKKEEFEIIGEFHQSTRINANGVEIFQKKFVPDSSEHYNQQANKTTLKTKYWVTFSKKQPSRSRQQLKYHMVLMGYLADYTGHTTEEMHEIIMQMKFGLEEKQYAGGTYKIRKSISDRAKFPKSDQALIRPNDILNTIVVSYIEAGLNSRNFHRHKSPVTVRCIETDSFKNRIQIEQQFVANQHHIN